MDATVKERLAAIAWAGWRVDTAALVPNPDLYPDRAPDVEVRDRALIDYHWHPDGAGWQHKVYAWLQGNNTGITHEVWDAEGRLVRTVNTAMPRVGGVAMKIDRLNIAQSGAKMVYAVAAHEVSSSPTRLVWGGTLVVENVCHPYPGGQEERGMDVPTALIGEPTQEPQPGGDPAAIAAAVVDLIQARMNGELGGQIQQRAKNGARQALQFEVGAALTALSAQPAFLQGLKDGLYQWGIDRAYEGARAALQEPRDGE
jgi:hypothetical protein